MGSLDSVESMDESLGL